MASQLGVVLDRAENMAKHVWIKQVRYPNRALRGAKTEREFEMEDELERLEGMVVGLRGLIEDA